MSAFAKLNPIDQEQRWPSGIDIFDRKETGETTWLLSLHLDNMTDMGLSDESRDKLKAGQEINIKRSGT